MLPSDAPPFSCPCLLGPQSSLPDKITLPRIIVNECSEKYCFGLSDKASSTADITHGYFFSSAPTNKEWLQWLQLHTRWNIHPRLIQQEQIFLECFARLNPDPKIWRERRNVLKEMKIFGGGKRKFGWKDKEKYGRNWLRERNSCSWRAGRKSKVIKSPLGHKKL